MKTGDVVYLKSGGLAMTVKVVVNQDCKCVWFNGGSTLEAQFPIVVLTDEKPKTFQLINRVNPENYNFGIDPK